MVKWIKNTKAFTLIELMIVVVIIGILVAVAVPNFMKYIDKGKDKPAVTEQYQEKKKGGHQGVY